MAKSTVKKLPVKRLAALKAALAEDDFAALSEIDMELGDCVAPQEWDHGFGSLSEARARFLASYYLVMEVNNGGFNQFLLNKGPDAVRPALAILDERGPKDVAAMLRKAVAALPGGRLPRSNEELTEILAGDDSEAIDEAHGELDDEFFEEDPSEAVIRARLEYVVEQAGEFFA